MNALRSLLRAAGDANNTFASSRAEGGNITPRSGRGADANAGENVAIKISNVVTRSTECTSF